MLDTAEIINIAKNKTIKNNKTNENIIIIKLIKEYCEENDVILNYEEGVNFMFTIYSTRPFKDSNKICNLLFDKGNIKYIILHTKIYNTELMISINNQRIVYFKLLFIPNPMVNKIFNISGHQIIELPILIKLLLEFNDKCSMSNLLDNENVDNDLLTTFVEENNIDETNKISFNTIKNNVIKELLLFVKTLDIILLDYYAIHDNINDFNETIQIIYQTDIITIIKNKLNKILNKLNIDGEIIINKDKTYIINDFRLNKILIYISIYNKKYKSFNKINIINCFNELSYNLIPVLKSNNLIPHPCILVRYLIINIIYTTLYSNKSHNNYKNSIKNIKLISKKNNIQIDDYIFIGIFKNEEIDLDILQVYRPYQYKLNTGDLRII